MGSIWALAFLTINERTVIEIKADWGVKATDEENAILNVLQRRKNTLLINLLINTSICVYIKMQRRIFHSEHLISLLYLVSQIIL